VQRERPAIPASHPRGAQGIVEDCLVFNIEERTSAARVYNVMRQLAASGPLA